MEPHELFTPDIPPATISFYAVAAVAFLHVRGVNLNLVIIEAIGKQMGVSFYDEPARGGLQICLLHSCFVLDLFDQYLIAALHIDSFLSGLSADTCAAERKPRIGIHQNLRTIDCVDASFYAVEHELD